MERLRKFTLKQARLLNNLSRRKVADELGIHPNTLEYWEKGWYNIPNDKLKELCKLYGVKRKEIELKKEKRK